MEDYAHYMAQAARYRELANSLDGYQRQAVMAVVQDMEAKAKALKRPPEQDEPRTR
jgi:hypothetical protein